MDKPVFAPETLYRVYSSKSRSVFDPLAGFKAEDKDLLQTSWTPHIADAIMSTALRNHLDWHSRAPTPFISTTSLFKKARALAALRVEKGQIAFIAEVRTRFIRPPYAQHLRYLKAMDLSRGLHVRESIESKSRDETEWLIPGEIPLEAITEIRCFTKESTDVVSFKGLSNVHWSQQSQTSQSLPTPVIGSSPVEVETLDHERTRKDLQPSTSRGTESSVASHFDPDCSATSPSTNAEISSSFNTEAGDETGLEKPLPSLLNKLEMASRELER